MTKAILGIIGGSGIYDLPGLENREQIKVESPWGKPSDDVTIGTIGGTKLIFLPRHGKGHTLTPSDINYRANIDVMKRCGVTDIVSVSACGSLRESFPPGHFVLVDQFIDRTIKREKTFFSKGCVAHVAMADPVSPLLVQRLEQAAKSEAIECSVGGTYLVMEGPQFSTRAESHMYRSWGCDVIGMTNMPEAKLAREAEMCYATIAMVTDFDCWHDDHQDVDITQIIKIMKDNSVNAAKMIARLAQDFPKEHEACPLGSDKALEYAIITKREEICPRAISKLDAIAGRVLNKS